MERTVSLPGVLTAGTAWTIPIGDDWYKQNYIIEGNEAYHKETTTFAFIDPVTPDYLSLLNLQYTSGSTASPADRVSPATLALAGGDQPLPGDDQWWSQLRLRAVPAAGQL